MNPLRQLLYISLAVTFLSFGMWLSTNNLLFLIPINIGALGYCVCAFLSLRTKGGKNVR